VWPALVDELTGRTLELDAGQECELAGEVDEPHLEPVGADEPRADDEQLRAQIEAEKARLAADEAQLAEH
ncbi:MAG: hypothetical protein ABSB73_11620, partial [Solirubrobacteraceae bacterium]